MTQRIERAVDRGITQEVDNLKADAERPVKEIAELSSEEGPVMR
jgi:hypothetical protein